jgi:lysophospholipase
MTQVRLPTRDGMSLAGRFWEGREPRGILVIAHGIGEHKGCYDHVAEDLAGRPGLVDVLAFDFRGHGESPGARGVVGRYEELVDDLGAALDWALTKRPGRPVFVLGHSNGGQVALRLARERGHEIAGLVLSNPSLAMRARIPPWKLLVGRILRVCAPGVTLATGLHHELMTRDEGSWPSRSADPLRHDRVSAPLFFGMVEGGPRLIEEAPEITVPTLVVLGGQDPVIDGQATRALFDRLGSPDKTLAVYPEMLHEPLNDLGREEVIERIASWIERRLPIPAREGAEAGQAPWRPPARSS